MSSSRLRRPPGALALGLAVLVGVAGSTGLLVSAKDRSDDVTRVEGMEEVLEEPSNDMPAENYLLVGSDSRESVDANDPNAAAIGTAEDAVGRRSDTIMVLRRERNGGASLLSLPRDLWVPIAGTNHSSKINSAYNEGPERLAATVTQALGIPINHYVEINFEGFTKLVDEIGGVQVCTYVQAQDTHSGLNLQPGCQILDGSQALAYARSRHYEEWKDGEWQEDGRADLGRIERQQLFIRTAVKALLEKVESDPFSHRRPDRCGDGDDQHRPEPRPGAGRRRAARGRRAGPADVQPPGRRRDEGRPGGARADRRGPSRSSTTSGAPARARSATTADRARLSA